MSSIKEINNLQLHGNAGCIVKKQGHILVVKLWGSRKWDIPAGKPLPGEISSKTAERETWEEAGVQVQVVRRLEFIEDPKEGSLYIYEAVALDQTLPLNTSLKLNNQFNQEVIEARFLPINNLALLI